MNSNEEITVFNHKTNKEETIKVNYDKIGNVDYNIKISAAIYQKNLYETLDTKNKSPKNKEIVGYTLQKYNMGRTTMINLLKKGKNWIENRKTIDIGDQYYLEHVLTRLKYAPTVLEDDNDQIIRFKLKDGSIFSTKITNTALNKAKTKKKTLN